MVEGVTLGISAPPFDTRRHIVIIATFRPNRSNHELDSRYGRSQPPWHNMIHCCKAAIVLVHVRRSRELVDALNSCFFLR
jgi:hypothetical protein